jgi:hypothetical protein
MKYHNSSNSFGWMKDGLDTARFFQAMPFVYNPDILAFVEGID